jgi:hypothetical protein
VKRPEIQAVLSHPELTTSQRADRMKKALLGLRYPRMHSREEKFEKKRKELNIPSNVFLYHQPFFEGKGLKVEFQFETVDEYRSMLSSLSKLADKKEFNEMIEGIK